MAITEDVNRRTSALFSGARSLLWIYAVLEMGQKPKWRGLYPVDPDDQGIGYLLKSERWFKLLASEDGWLTQHQ